MVNNQQLDTKEHQPCIHKRDQNDLEVREAWEESLLDYVKAPPHNSISKAAWCTEFNEFKIIYTKGKLIGNLGHSNRGSSNGAGIYLYIEEAIYLLEQGSIELIYNDAPLTLQEGYQLFDVNGYSFHKYQGYCYLKRIGFNVVRYIYNNELTITNKPKVKKNDKQSKNNNNNDDGNNNEIDERGFRIISTKEKEDILIYIQSIYNKSSQNNIDNIDNNNEIETNKKIKCRNWLKELNGLNELETCTKDYKSEIMITPIDNYKVPKIIPKPCIESILVKRKEIEQTNIASYDILDSNFKLPTKYHPIQSIVHLPNDLNNNQTLNSINRKLQIISPILLTNQYNNQNNQNDNISIDYNVYRPNNTFKKTDPGLPDYRVIIKKVEEGVPSWKELSRIKTIPNPEIPLKICIVSHGDITFISLDQLTRA